MFADDTFSFLFFLLEHSNINTLFKTVNDELIKLNQWFSASKLSLYMQEKPSFHFFSLSFFIVDKVLT